MTSGPSIDVSGWLEEHLGQASPDLLRAMVRSFAQALMSAEADACAARSTASAARTGRIPELPAAGVGYPGWLD